jgi:20S proteasome alpha/beta subunit
VYGDPVASAGMRARAATAIAVCIAAICNIGEGLAPMVITASDRMITIDGIGYEPNQTKIVNLASRTVALLAGDMQLHAAVVPRVIQKIKATLAEEDRHEILVSEIADFYAEEFSSYQRGRAEREVLFPRGSDFEKFYNRQTLMPHYQYREIDLALSSYFIESTAIVTGIDSTGGHVYKVRTPGVADCMDTPFFACAGSGESLASVQFMLARYDKLWPPARALLLVYSAKERAEATTTVGRETDITLIRTGPNAIVPISKEEKDKLHEIFERRLVKESAAEKEAFEELVEHIEKTAGGNAKSSQDSQTQGVAGSEKSAKIEGAAIE